MARSLDHDEPRTASVHTTEATSGVPVLIVIGDAQHLGASRKVLRIHESLEIGRRPTAVGDAAWALEDGRVSRRHALLKVDKAHRRALIEDLDSRNGTIVDGRTTRAATAELKPGSLVFIGSFAALFRYPSGEELEAIALDLADPFTQVAATSPALARRSHTPRPLAQGS